VRVERRGLGADHERQLAAPSRRFARPAGCAWGAGACRCAGGARRAGGAGRPSRAGRAVRRRGAGAGLGTRLGRSGAGRAKQQEQCEAASRRC